jgi:MoaA/NifB/PqqE/SkfB family radical SAM enzyme
MGYRVLAVSGGEPVLYRPLPRLLAAARAQGMTTTVSSNATVLSRDGARRLAGLVDLVAVSVDGTPDSHDRMRGKKGAFTGMVRGLGHLRAAGLPFAILVTLTQRNLHELPFVHAFAREQGASLLQVHPLDGQGRALETVVAGDRPDPLELTVAAVLARELGAGTDPPVHVDVVTRDQIIADPARFLGDGMVREGPLAAWVHPLVVRADGVVLPVTHDFPEELGLGSLREASLRQLVTSWRADGRAERFAACCGRAHEVLTGDEGPAVSYWYEALTAAVRADLASVSRCAG